jgi:hypothetical protein
VSVKQVIDQNTIIDFEIMSAPLARSADGFGTVATPNRGANDLTCLLLPLFAHEATRLDAPAGGCRLSQRDRRGRQ